MHVPTLTFGFECLINEDIWVEKLRMRMHPVILLVNLLFLAQGIERSATRASNRIRVRCSSKKCVPPPAFRFCVTAVYCFCWEKIQR